MKIEKEFDRRDFIKTSANAVSGLLLCFYLPFRVKGTDAILNGCNNSGNFRPNAFLNIHPNGRITIWVTRSEMGQGVRTSLPMIIADEMEADWSQIDLKQAWPNATFEGIRLRTSGSGSIEGSWKPLRTAGAIAREMLTTAAAMQWQADVEDCRAEKGSIIHIPSGKKLAYGELSQAASKLDQPEKPRLKEPNEYRYIGKSTKRIDGEAIVSGKAIYGLDVKIPNMKYAVIEHAPSLGAVVTSWDDSESKRIPGVFATVPVVTGISNGVAVVADNLWAAMKGREVLQIEWDQTANGGFTSVAFHSKLMDSINKEGFTTRSEGKLNNAITNTQNKLESIYEYPFQAHAPLETMNCTAIVTEGNCEIWVSTQTPRTATTKVANLLGLDEEDITVHVPLLGGGFGRRLFVDYVIETVEISKAIDAPVQVVWTRVDDTKHGFFHPATICKLTAGMDSNKHITYLSHKCVSSDLSMFGKPSLKVDEYIDGWIPWGAYDNPYKFSAFEANYVHVESPVPTGAWRAVFYNQNVFARECFIDEIAHEIGRDPLALRLRLLNTHDVELQIYKIERKRLKNVLEVVMEKSDWQASLQKEDGKRWGKGVACNIYHERNFMAYVAEVLVDKENNISVQRIVCVVDCGQVINPSGLKGQIESGIAWGLSASLKGGITFKDGGVEQNSYKDFEVVRINEMPEVDIHLIENTTHPAGIGEPPVPMVAPAVANAVFAATGQRLRKVPLILAS